MKLFFSILAICLLSSSCLRTPWRQSQIVTKDDLYSLEIPSFLVETKSLNADASLQYNNPVTEYYIIVIDENKAATDSALNSLEDFSPASLKTYSELLFENYCENSNILAKTAFTDTVANNLKMRRTAIRSTVEGNEVYMLYAFIEGKEHYYQVMTWTLAERKEKFSGQMERSIYSFKEL